MNFARDVVEAAPPAAWRSSSWRATARDASGASARSPSGPAGSPARSPRTASGRGDVVMTLLGNRPEWVLTMVACFRLGAVGSPAPSSCAPKDLRLRLEVARPALVVADERNRGVLEAARLDGADALASRAASCTRRGPAARRARRPATRASSRSRPARRASRRRSCTASATCPASACRPSTGWRAQPGDLVWCTAASGWSKSARNAFIAPWLRGAAALLHDARFDPAERLDIARARAGRTCSAWRRRSTASSPSARSCGRSPRCAASSPPARRSTPRCSRAWHEATGLWIRDGYGQTETGQLTGHAARRAAPGPARWAARCPGVRLDVVDGELVLDPASDPTFFLHRRDLEPSTPASAVARATSPWAIGAIAAAVRIELVEVGPTCACRIVPASP